MSVGELSERLRIRHHSAVELVDRLSRAGLLKREPDTQDHRRILLHVTPQAEGHLAALSSVHLEEIARIEPVLKRLVDRSGESS